MAKKKKSDITKDLTLLGSVVREPVKQLEAFPNEHEGRRYWVTLVCPEFTAICPMTGQPDFGTITIRYIPYKKVVESKSLKLYLWAYRNEGIFHEQVINQMLDDFVEVLDPLEMHVKGDFNVRGGIYLTVEASHTRGEKN